MFGYPETTTGGNALKFYASVRLDIRRIGALKEGDEAVGNHVRVKVVKNKVAPPFKQAEFDIMYGSGISWVGERVDLGIEHEGHREVGRVVQLDGERLGQGARIRARSCASIPTSCSRCSLASRPKRQRARPSRRVCCRRSTRLRPR